MNPVRNSNPSVVISLVVYNGEPYLKRCLQSVNAQTYTDYSLVILDNASLDNSRQLMRRFAPDATFIFLKQNSGFSRAHNMVIRSTHSEFIFILNQACILSPDYIDRCIATLKQGEHRSSVTGSLVRMDRLTDFAQNDTIDTLGLCIRRTFHVSNIGAGLSSKSLPSTPFSIFGVSATAALYRRLALDDVAHSGSHIEYFDEDFFMYKEDVDLAFRLQQRGWTAWCEPQARGSHVRSTKSNLFVRSNPKINMLSYQNHILFLMKNVTGPLALRFGFFIAFYEILKFFFLSVREPSTLRALIGVWKLRNRIKSKRSSSRKYHYPLSFGCAMPPYDH